MVLLKEIKNLKLVLVRNLNLMKNVINNRLSNALEYANDLKYMINYKNIINGEYDKLINFNQICNETINYFIGTEEYEICQKIRNKINKI